MRTSSYIALLGDLLPPGQAWTREANTTLYLVLTFIASELSRIHGRGDNLINEADPRSTIEMLSDWERVAGLPDTCSPSNLTIQERQAALTQKITATGGQSNAYWHDIATKLGYQIEIVEHRPFTCGLSACGSNQQGPQSIINHILGEATIRHLWHVTVLGPRVTWFRCGLSELGKDPFARIQTAVDLECILRKYKPAHTKLNFSYQ